MNKRKFEKKEQEYCKIFAISTIGLLFFSVFIGLVKNVSTDGTGNYPPQDQGDWIISEETLVWDETREINGNISIIENGNLTLDNVILTVNGNITINNEGLMNVVSTMIKINSTFKGEFHIEVKSGGILNILDEDNDPVTRFDQSNITAVDRHNEFKFLVNESAEFVMKNSVLSECGYAIGEVDSAGLTILANNTIIENCSIFNNFIGIILSNSNGHQILNNLVYNNSNGGLFQYISENNVIMNNNFSHNQESYAVYYLYSNNSQFVNNTVISNRGSGGLMLSYSFDNIVRKNNLSWNWGQSFTVYFSNNSHISDNVFNGGSFQSSFYFESSFNNIITNTNISGGFRGIHLKESQNNSIIDSELYNINSNDFYLDMSSEIFVINTTFNRNNVHFEDSDSILNVQYFLDVQVESDNNVQVYDANIIVEDVNEIEEFNGNTGINGWSRDIICTEYQQNDAGKIQKSPHKITAEKIGYISNSTNIDFTEPNNFDKEIIMNIEQLVKSQIGYSVSYAGDINNDGFEDVIVGAPMDGTNAKEAGAVYIYFGYQGFDVDELDGIDANVTLFGNEAYENFGYSISGAIDINNDDFDDIIVGAPNKIQQGGLSGEYFNSEAFNNLVLTRKDSTINFDWGDGSPSPEVNSDNFGVRWTGIIYVPENNDYTFYMLADDTTRLEIDDVELFYDTTWNTEDSATVFLLEGYHKIKAEMTEGGGGANAYLRWESSNIAKQIIPQEYFFIDIGAAYVFFGSDSMNKTLNSTEADTTFLGKKTDENFGSSVTGVGKVNGDEYDDFIIGGYGANNALLVYGGKNLGDDKSYMVDLWDDDFDEIVDFTDNINSTGDTWSPDGDDDGWDTSPTGIYGGSETEVRFNPSIGATGENRSINTVDELQIEIGGGSGNGGQASGAYGIEINITQELFDLMDKAMLNFEWKLMEWGHEDDEQLWIKARFGNSSQMNYLGTNQDSGADASNEILYFVGDSNDNTVTGTFDEEITNYIKEPGNYYLELGGKNTAWTTDEEYMVAAFDDVSLKFIQFGSPSAIIEGENQGDNFGFSISTAGDVNDDTYSDFIISAPNFNNHGKVYLYYGHENMEQDITANSTITGNGQDGKFGFSVDTAGDIDGDGYDDIIIGAPEIGTSYIYYGGEGGIDYNTITLDTTREFNSGTPDNVSVGSDEIKLGISGNIVPNGFFDDDWEQWSFSGGASRHDTSSPNGMVNVVNGDWKLGPISGGPTAGFGSDYDTIGGGSNSDCDGRLRSAAFTIPSDLDYIHIWYHWKVNDFDQWGGNTDGVRLRLYDSSNDNELLTFAEHMASGIRQDWENEDELITDISAYHGYSVYIELRIICDNSNGDKGLAQIDDIYSCDSVGNPADPSLFGNYTSKIFKTEADILGIMPTWNETLNGGSIEIKFKADNSVSWDDAQLVTNDELLNFDTPGNDLQFRASFETPDNQSTPILHDITFEYFSNPLKTVLTGDSDSKFGYSVSTGGDINYDGYSEVIIGAPFNNVNGNNAGASYVFYGEEFMSNLLSTNDAFSTYYGDGSENYFGYSVSHAGNIDNIDMREIIIGAPFFENKKGISYIIGVKQDDVGVLVINNPKEGDLLDSEQNLKINVTIANFGINTQNNFNVDLIITCLEDSANDYSAGLIISSDLLPGKKRLLEFDWTVPEEDSYSYVIQVLTKLTGDMETRNDEKIINVIVRGTDFSPIEIGFRRGDGKWIYGERRAIENQTTTIIANITNIGNKDGMNLNVSFFDNDNLIDYRYNINLAVLEIITIEIFWTPSEGAHEIRVEVDPNDEFIEYNENNNSLSSFVDVNPNIPLKPFIFWIQVNYNWGTMSKVPNAPVLIKNIRLDEIIAENKTVDNEGKKIHGKCRFVLDESQYLEGDELIIIAKNAVLNENEPLNKIPEGTYITKKSFFVYSNDSRDDMDYPIKIVLEPYGLILNTISDDESIKIGSAAKFSIYIKVAPDIPEGMENQIVNIEIPSMTETEIIENWTIFFSGEEISSDNNKYSMNVGTENKHIELVIIPSEDTLLNTLDTEIIVSMETYIIASYPLMFTTNIERTALNLTIDGIEISEKIADPGDILKYDILITNKGTITDSVSLVVAGINNQWAYLSETEFILGKVGDSKQKHMELTVKIPTNAKYPDYASLNIYAVSNDGKISSIVTAIANVREKNHSVLLNVIDTNSNGIKTNYYIEISNDGEFDELINLKIIGSIKWEPQLNDTDIFIEIGKRAFVTLTLTHPEEEKFWGGNNDFFINASYDDKYTLFPINKPPFANIVLSYKNDILGIRSVESTITADASYTKDDGTELKYSWNFGDGEISKKMTDQHKYKNSGKYTITLIVEDSFGLIDMTEREVVIENHYSPVINVIYPLNESINVEDEIIEIILNNPIILDSSKSSDKDGYITNYTWDFGEGNLRYGELIYWNYSEIGDYQIKLTIEDNEGKKVSTEIDVNVVEKKDDDNGKIEGDGDNNLSSWYLIPMLVAIILLIILVGFAYNKVKIIQTKIDNKKIPEEKSYYVEEEIIQPEKKEIKTEEEKIKEEFTKEESETPKQEIFEDNQEKDINNELPPIDEEIAPPIPEEPMKPVDIQEPLVEEKTAETSEQVPTQSKEEVSFEEQKTGEIQEPVKDTEQTSQAKEKPKDDDWWNSWEEESKFK